MLIWQAAVLHDHRLIVVGGAGGKGAVELAGLAHQPRGNANAERAPEPRWR
jgi:hypothetical protein